MVSGLERRSPRTIAVFSGSRGEYGYIRPIMRELQRRASIELRVIVCEMHTDPDFGTTYREFERDGFQVDASIQNTRPERSATSSIEDLGVLMQRIAGVLTQMAPDVILLAGDRREQLIVAIAAASLGIATAHIQGGEVSGHFDGVFRHAISRIAHVHLVANELCARRVRALGEHGWRIHVVGAPQLDEIVDGHLADPHEILPRLGLAAGRYLVVLLHPCAQDAAASGDIATNLRDALDEWLARSPERRVLWISSNNDPHSGAIRELLGGLSDRYVVVPSLPRFEFLSLVRASAGLVGNSSCGIIEAPSLGIPALNVGLRQRNRQHAAHTVHVETSLEAIRGGLTALATVDRPDDANPYFRAGSSRAIADILEQLPLTEALITKQYEDPLDAGDAR
jgi:UDP-hydrolysing UDP-N-acetyl-D-glucosamine 2-epimerase